MGSWQTSPSASNWHVLQHALFLSLSGEREDKLTSGSFQLVFGHVETPQVTHVLQTHLVPLNI